MSKTLHLKKRKGIWYYRRRVPDDVIQKVGKKFIQFSLRTNDLSKAIKLREEEDVKTTALFDAAINNKPLPLTKTLAVRLVQQYVETQDKKRQDRTLTEPLANEISRAELKADFGLSEQILTDRDDPRAFEDISVTQRKILNSSQFSLEDGTISSSEVTELIRRALIEIYRRSKAHLNEDYSSQYFDHLFTPDARITMTFGELCSEFFEQYREDANFKKVSQKRIDKVETQLELIKEIIGYDTPIQSIDYDLCIKFRNTLAKVPANKTKLYGAKSLDDAIALGELNDKPTLSYETQKDYFRSLNMVLTLAANKRLIPNVPSSGMNPSAQRIAADKKRIPFDNQQIKAFFASEYYRECAEKGQPPYSAAQEPWRFWLPLLCLLMGMRPKEVCQLHVHDVKRTDSGVYYLSIVATEDDEEASDDPTLIKTTKTETSKRKIPIHPEIMRIGFSHYSANLLENKDKALFSNLRVNKYGDKAQYALKRFREKYLKEAIQVKTRQSFYSFRHSFRDALRRIEAPPEVLQALGGWRQSGLASDAYGDKFDPDNLSNYVDRIEYPGLDLSHLYLEEAKLTDDKG